MYKNKLFIREILFCCFFFNFVRVHICQRIRNLSFSLATCTDKREENIPRGFFCLLHFLCFTFAKELNIFLYLSLSFAFCVFTFAKELKCLSLSLSLSLSRPVRTRGKAISPESRPCQITVTRTRCQRTPQQ